MADDREVMEASDLGLGAGQWPAMLILPERSGRHSAAERTYYRGEVVREGEEMVGFTYRAVTGHTVLILND